MATAGRIAIIGAGISGLTTAYYLQKARQDLGLNLDLTLLERNQHLGGVIQTERVSDFLLESGPEGWASYKRAASNLIRELGLTDQLLGSNDEQRRTFIARSGGLEALPEGMTLLAPVEPMEFWRTARISRRGKLRAFMEPFVPRSTGDLSTREFFTRRLGAEFADELVEPFIAAIFGADFNRLSTASVLPELYRSEQRAGSLWKGLRPLAKMSLSTSVLFTLRDGMSYLTQTLEKKLSQIRVVRNVSDLKLQRSGDSLVVKGREFEAAYDQIIFSTPAHATARIAQEVCPDLVPSLTDIPYSSSTLVYLAYKKDEFSHPRNGFGFIVPESEADVLDACTWVDRKFDGRCPPEFVLLRCAIHDGRRKRPNLSDEDLGEHVHQEITRFMGLNCTPVFQRVIRVGQAIPQLLVGHVERIDRIRSALARTPRIHLAASFYSGVGVPDCIQTAKETADAIVAEIGGNR